MAIKTHGKLPNWMYETSINNASLNEIFIVLREMFSKEQWNVFSKYIQQSIVWMNNVDNNCNKKITEH